MARRSVLLLVAVLVGVLGAGLVVMYVKGIDDRATKDQELVEVLVATSEIEVGESVSDAQTAGKIEKKKVRRADMVEGALTSTGTVSDRVALGAIFPGEQLIEAKFGTIGQADGGLIIPDKRMAVSVELTDFERVAGFVAPGSEVAVFATAQDLSLLRPAGEDVPLGDVTRVVLTRVPVLAVGATSLTSKTTKTEDGEQVVEEVPSTILTLGLNQNEAERLILADRTSDLTFALLDKDSDINNKAGVRPNDLFPDLMVAP